MYLGVYVRWIFWLDGKEYVLGCVVILLSAQLAEFISDVIL
jgi:hypothetical protein